MNARKSHIGSFAKLGLVLGVNAYLAVCMLVDSHADAPDPGFPSDSDLQYLDLGSFDLKDTGDFTGEMTLSVPEDATSVIVHCGEYGSKALAAPWYVKDPSGKTLLDQDKPEESVLRAEFVDDRSAMVLPTSPEVPLTPGDWTVQYWVGGGNTGKAKCDAILRTTEVSDDPLVGMQFIFVGLPDLNSGNAAESEGFQEFVKTVSKDFEGAGVELVWSTTDFTGDVEKYTVLDMADDDLTELNNLLKQSKPPTKKVIPVFLVQEINNHSHQGGTVLGLSAGPPGTAGLPGTSKSGLVVSAMDLEYAPKDVARILSHELGHFLGLFHTTEKDGSHHDPLVDTPECGEDGNGNGVLNTHECEKSGSRNVMWWTLRQDHLYRPMSENQAWLLRRSPAAQ